MIGVAVSLGVHIVILTILNSIYRWMPSGAGGEPVTYEFAILQEEELTELEQSVFDELTAEEIQDLQALSEDSSEVMQPDIPAVEMEFSSSGAMPTLGGSGGEEGVGLTGGGAGTSFFGISSKGTRFAYIVDKSGSMSDGTKMSVAKRELARSIKSLPDYAQFYIVMFSSNFSMPHFQDGWMRAKNSLVARVIRWLNNEVDPGGGTEPRDAFVQVFSLAVRPDVIFFLTDGEITSFSAEELKEMNSQGKRVIINTIAFGDPSSQDLLKQIASQSGGVYRFESANGD